MLTLITIGVLILLGLAILCFAAYKIKAESFKSAERHTEELRKPQRPRLLPLRRMNYEGIPIPVARSRRRRGLNRQLQKPGSRPKTRDGGHRVSITRGNHIRDHFPHVLAGSREPRAPAGRGVGQANERVLIRISGAGADRRRVFQSRPVTRMVMLMRPSGRAHPAGAVPGWTLVTPW